VTAATATHTALAATLADLDAQLETLRAEQHAAQVAAVTAERARQAAEVERTLDSEFAAYVARRAQHSAALAEYAAAQFAAEGRLSKLNAQLRTLRPDGGAGRTMPSDRDVKFAFELESSVQRLRHEADRLRRKAALGSPLAQGSAPPVACRVANSIRRG
jgi:chromosome segregation ATPase